MGPVIAIGDRLGNLSLHVAERAGLCIVWVPPGFYLFRSALCSLPGKPKPDPGPPGYGSVPPNAEYMVQNILLFRR